jgi:intraflagellar transport protein 52
MFDTHLYSINNNLLRDVIDTYEKLNVLYEPLKIIKPQFEIPLPQLQLAVRERPRFYFKKKIYI